MARVRLDDLKRSDTARTVVADYRAECQRSRETIQRAGLDELSTRPTPSGLQVALQWVALHVIEQTNRHAGHADVLRHLIDGATGPSAATGASQWKSHAGQASWLRTRQP